MSKVVIFDTETIGLKDLRIFDFGYTIIDLETSEYTSEGFLVDEVYNSEDFKKAFYYEKNKDYYAEAVAKGEIEVKKASELKTALNTLLSDKDIKYFGAFNVDFDLRALNYTLLHYNIMDKQITKDRIKKFAHIVDPSYAFIAGGETACYKCFTKRNGLVTKTKNPKTTVEAMFAYVRNDASIKEAHTAIEDSIQEAEIFHYFYLRASDTEAYLNKLIKYSRDTRKPHQIIK